MIRMNYREAQALECSIQLPKAPFSRTLQHLV
jgi:hypothetical protein